MTRQLALAHITYAGYHNDKRRGARLYVENRVSLAAYQKAWAEGVRAKAAGVHCSCTECRETQKIPPCAAMMGCLCVGHACGNDADAACDTNEERYL